jgi:hypothetical protein
MTGSDIDIKKYEATVRQRGQMLASKKLVTVEHSKTKTIDRKFKYLLVFIMFEFLKTLFKNFEMMRPEQQ